MISKLLRGQKKVTDKNLKVNYRLVCYDKSYHKLCMINYSFVIQTKTYL